MGRGQQAKRVGTASGLAQYCDSLGNYQELDKGDTFDPRARGLIDVELGLLASPSCADRRAEQGSAYHPVDFGSVTN